jgi:hypothetical protein
MSVDSRGWEEVRAQARVKAIVDRLGSTAKR